MESRAVSESLRLVTPSLVSAETINLFGNTDIDFHNLTRLICILCLLICRNVVILKDNHLVIFYQ